MTTVHPTAIVDPCAALGVDVTVGPFAIVGPEVTLGDGVTVGPHAVIERNVRAGARCRFGVGAVVGGDPQDLKFKGEESWVEIGAGSNIREYVTINRGTAASGTTRIGERCYLMSYVHVAHDCIIGDDVIIANSVQLGGHVEIGHHAAIGGLTPIHQFVRIGQYAFVGGGSRVAMDVAPYARAAGNPLRLVGPNSLGLERCGFPDSTRAALKQAYRILFNSSLRLSEALAALAGSDVPEVKELAAFVGSSARGVTR